MGWLCCSCYYYGLMIIVAKPSLSSVTCNKVLPPNCIIVHTVCLTLRPWQVLPIPDSLLSDENSKDYKQYPFPSLVLRGESPQFCKQERKIQTA